MLILTIAIRSVGSHAQTTPTSPEKVWHSKAGQDLDRGLGLHPEAKYDIELLAGRTDQLAEQHNPETLVACQEAKARAASLCGYSRLSAIQT